MQQGPSTPAPAGAELDAAIQAAVEIFVGQCSVGDAPDPVEFASRYAPDLRPGILAQCREFLAFDGLLGHHEWEPAADPTPPGRTFGDFVIETELGRGGMGVVYLARQRSLNRRVALKVMAAGLTLSKRHVERFRREAAAAAQLRHPAIVAVHSLVEVDGAFALAMDYVAGRNLADVLDDLRLANGDSGTIEGTLGLAPDKGYVAECALLAAAIASALAAAHQGGVVHRDLKPRNLMLDDRAQVRLLDFGLAKSLDAARADHSLSMSGEITGTAYYLSPEQTMARRVPVDHRADIWALGVILYELLTLRRPFDGRNLQQIVYAICFQEPVPPQRLNPKVPRDLVTICLKALEKDPHNRYASAGEFEADLLRFLRWEPIQARPAGALTRLAKFVRRHRAETLAGGLALGVATAVLAAVAWQGRIASQRATALLATAEQHAAAGDLAAAISAANQALELRNDLTTRARLEVFHADSKRIATEAAWKVARSTQLLDHDREGALLLALDAERQVSSPATRSAVLDALGGGFAVYDLQAKGVVAAGWSPDGETIATAGFGGALLLHAPTGGEPLLALRGHEGSTPVVGAVFAAGNRLLSASPDRTLRCFRTDGSAEWTAALPGAAAALAIDAGGRLALVTTYAPGGPHAAQVWDAATGRPRSPPVEHHAYVVAAALSPDGELAATACSADGDLVLWRTATGERLPTAAGSAGVRALAFTPDGALCAAAHADGEVRLHRTADGALAGVLRHPRAVTSLAFDGAGARLVTGSRDQTARLWQLNATTAGLEVREIGVLVGHGGPVHAVAFAPGDQLVATATGSPDCVLRLFDVGARRPPAGEAIRRYEVGTSIDRVQFDAEGRRLLAVAGSRALIWDFGAARGVATVRQPGPVPAVAFDQHGQRVVTAGDDERLRLFHARDGRLEWTSERLGNPVRTLDVDAAAERIACSTTDGRLRVHRFADGERLYVLDGHRGTVPVVRFCGAGARLLAAGTEPGDPPTGLVILWNTVDLSIASRIERPGPIVAADVTADAQLLATVERGEAVVRLFRLPGAEPAGELRGHNGRITWLGFTPDGTALWTAGADGTARRTPLGGGEPTVIAAGEPLSFAALSADGSLLLTCAATRTAMARLWRTTDGSELLHFTGHRGAIEWGAMSRDGAWAVTAARDGTVCVWPTDPVGTARRLSLRAPGHADPQPRGLAPETPR